MHFATNVSHLYFWNRYEILEKKKNTNRKTTQKGFRKFLTHKPFFAKYAFTYREKAFLKYSYKSFANPKLHDTKILENSPKSLFLTTQASCKAYSTCKHAHVHVQYGTYLHEKNQR